jgi:hypothetical protein
MKLFTKKAQYFTPRFRIYNTKRLMSNYLMEDSSVLDVPVCIMSLNYLNTPSTSNVDLYDSKAMTGNLYNKYYP